MGDVLAVVLVPLGLIAMALLLARIEKQVGGGARSVPAPWRTGRGRPIGRDRPTTTTGARTDAVVDDPADDVAADAVGGDAEG